MNKYRGDISFPKSDILRETLASKGTYSWSTKRPSLNPASTPSRWLASQTNNLLHRRVYQVPGLYHQRRRIHPGRSSLNECRGHRTNTSSYSHFGYIVALSGQLVIYRTCSLLFPTAFRCYSPCAGNRHRDQALPWTCHQLPIAEYSYLSPEGVCI